MNDKILIVIGLVLAVVFGGVIWFYGQNSDQEANIGQIAVNTDKETEVNDSNEVILVDADKINGRILGQEDAPVFIEEYFSYGCGYCAKFHEETFPQIVKNYINTGQVKFEAKQLFGAQALPLATLCAGDQGQYLAMHSYLLENIAQIQDIEALKVVAKELGLDQTEFDTCFDSGKYIDQIFQDEADGEAKQLEGVPAFYINGQEVFGSQPYEAFAQMIEAALVK